LYVGTSPPDIKECVSKQSGSRLLTPLEEVAYLNPQRQGSSRPRHPKDFTHKIMSRDGRLDRSSRRQSQLSSFLREVSKMPVLSFGLVSICLTIFELFSANRICPGNFIRLQRTTRRDSFALRSNANSPHVRLCGSLTGCIFSASVLWLLGFLRSLSLVIYSASRHCYPDAPPLFARVIPALVLCAPCPPWYWCLRRYLRRIHFRV
jgi:hypothetical protein